MSSTPFGRLGRLVAATILAGGLLMTGCASDDAATATGGSQGSVRISVIGPNADGGDCDYVGEREYARADVDGAWDASQRAFDEGNLTYDASSSDYGVMLNSITSPATGEVLAFNEEDGTYWQLFVDGEASEVGIDGVELKDDTDIVWYYSAFGDALPEVAGLATYEPLADAA